MHGPTETITLAGTMEDLARRGFTEHFMLVDGKLRALARGDTFTPDQALIAEYHRFEGVSDPDDMAILYGIETHNGLRGTLADAFGVYSDPGVSTFMRSVAFRRAHETR
jgi:hypothetical protein